MGLYVINIYYILGCQIIPIMKWTNSVSGLLYVMRSGPFKCVECVLMTLWFSDGLNYIKSDNNTIMLLVFGEHNYRQLSD
jgi:hypothetical protein